MEMIQHSESVLDDTVPSPPVSSANHTNPAGQPGYQDLTSPRDVDYVDSPCSDPGADDTKSGDGEASSSMSDANYPPDIKYGIEELCPVCGDKVSGYHYGLLTCESCKGFFKRTVQNKKVYSCVDNRNCAIDKTQRKRCPYCRFQKCLSVGMKLEAVRPDRMRGGRNKFGPMYKRDRAMKQQAIRQRQHILAQYQMHMAANGGMGPLPPPDSLDIKPDISAINMAVASMGTPLPPHNTNQGYNSLPPPPMHGQHMIPSGPPVQIDDGPNSPTAVDMTASSSSSQGHYRTPPHPHHPHAPRYHPPVPQAIPDMSHPPPLQSMYPMQEQMPQPPVVPQLIKDLRINELNEHEIQQKMARFAENEFLQIQHQPQPNQEINQPRDLTRDFLQLMCKLCDQCLFLLVEWARSSTFFKALKVEDQMKLLQNCWSELLILDFIYRQRAHNKTDEYLMVTGQSMKAEMFTRLGLSDVEQRLQDVSKKMRELRIDRNEYTCLKFLILLNPDVSSLQERSNVEDSQEKINAALLEYCSGFYPHIKDKFGQLLLRLPEIRVISLRIEEYLYLRHLGGEVPEQTLLMEMLHAKRK